MEWISVEDELPEPEVLVHAYCEGEFFHIRYHEDGYWVGPGHWPCGFTPSAWHELKPPKDK